MRTGLGKAAALLLLSGAAFLPWMPGISVAKPGEDPVLVLPLRRDETFSIRFIHSVDRLPIVEHYRRDRNGLVQTETRLLSFGAGTGHIEGQGTVTEDGPWTVITGLNRPIGRLRQRIGSEAVDHTLIWRGCSWRLSQRFSGEVLIIEATRLNGLDYLRLTWKLRSGCPGKEALDPS